MRFQNVYVVRDAAGNYIAPRETVEGNYFSVAFTGDATGFTFYSNKETATK